MFEHINAATPATTPATTTSSTSELTRTVQFLSAIVAEELRLTYAALAAAAEMLGEHRRSGLSAGQRGAQLCKRLPAELQPHICRSNGSYSKGRTWPVEVPDNLAERAFIRPEVVGPYVAAWEAATTESTEESTEAATEESTEESTEE